MKATKLSIPEVILLEPRVFSDERGFFFESFNHEKFTELTGVDVKFVQDNHSMSAKGVLRGLHYQLPPTAQGKLVRVVSGAAFDVAVDIRKDSPTFGKWASETLSATNRKQLWIPEGFAHGFLALEDNTEFLYKTTNYYSEENERSIIWNDSEININWPEIEEIIVSEKDKEGRHLKDSEVF